MRVRRLPLIRAALRPALARSAATALGLAALGVAGFAPLAVPGPAAAGPRGGQVQGGEARIVTRGNVTTIRQGSQRVVIDWASFDIDPNDVVRFLQPGGDAVALNRILSGMPTHIRGKLTANGNVWLVNPSGVMFHAGSVIDVGGLVATSAGIDTDAFMAGSGRFDQPGEPGAKVINEGEITFAEAGLVGLVAPHAENRGTIRGKLGRIVIAGQESLSVDVSGEGLFEIDLRDAAKIEGAQAGNSGVILAEGGTVIISASAARNAVESAVSVSGVVVASSARVEGGAIVLDGGAGGVEVSGRLEAASATAGGGSVDISGGRVTLTETARIDVSGATGGGRVRMGGDIAAIKAGTALELAEATRTQITAGARIRADATRTGQGGEVTAWSSEATVVDGAISARGGPQGGDGGFVELSSRLGLGFAGTVDLGAADGRRGLLLLDPQDVFISNGGDPILGDIDGDAPPLTLTLDPGSLEFSNADIRIEATRDIHVADAVVMRDPRASLTLAAGRDLFLLANFDIAGDLSLIADATVFGAGGLLQLPDGEGLIDVATGVQLFVPDGRLELSAPEGIVGAGMTPAGALRLHAGGDLTIPETTLTGTLFVRADGAVELGGGAVGALDVSAFGVAGGITQAGALTVAGTSLLSATRDVTLALANDFGGAVTVTADTVSLRDVNFLEISDSEVFGDLTAAAGTAAETVQVTRDPYQAALHLDGVDVGSGAGSLVATTVSGGVALVNIRAGDISVAGASGGAVAGDMRGHAILTGGLSIAASGLASGVNGIMLSNLRADGAVSLSDAPNLTLLGASFAPDFGVDLGDVPGLLTLERTVFAGDMSIAVDGDVDLALVRSTPGGSTDGDLTIAAGGDIHKRTSNDIDLIAAGFGVGAYFITLSPTERLTVAAPHAGSYDRLLRVAGNLDLAAGGAILVPGIEFQADKRTTVGGETRLAAQGDVVVDFLGDVTLAGLSSERDATLRVEGALDQSGAVYVADRLDLLVAGDVSLGLSGNDFNTLGGDVGGSTVLGDADGFLVEDFRGGALSASTASGDVTLRDLVVAGDLAAQGDRLTLSRGRVDGAADLVSRTGALTVTDLAAGGALVANSAGTADVARVSLAGLQVEATDDIAVIDVAAGATALASSAGAVSVENLRAGSLLALAHTGFSAHGLIADSLEADAGGGVLLGGVATTGTLDVNAGGDILSLADGPDRLAAFEVAGPRAARIGLEVDAILGDPIRDQVTAEFAAVPPVSVGAEALSALIRAGGDARFAATNDISILSEAPAEGGLFNRFAGQLTLQAGGAATIEAAGAVELAGTVAGDLSLRANADGAVVAGGAPGIAQHDALSVGGHADFILGAGADPVAAQRGDVSLDRAGNAFGTVSVIAGSAALRDADGFALTASDLSGRLILGGGGVAQAGDASLSTTEAAGGAEVLIAGALSLSDLTLGAASTLESGGDLSASGLDLGAGALTLIAGAGLSADHVTAGTTRATGGTGLSLAASALGDATLTATTGAARLDRLTAGALSATSGDAMTVTALDVGAATLAAGTGLDVSALTADTLAATAGGALSVATAQVAGDAALQAGKAVSLADSAYAGALVAASGAGFGMDIAALSAAAADLASGDALGVDGVDIVGGLSARSVGAMTLSAVASGAATLVSDAGLAATGLDVGPLTATASGDLAIDGAAVAGDAALSGAAVSLANVAATGGLSATAADALSATTISAGATSLSAGGGLMAAGLDTGPLTATASGDLAIDGAAVAGDAALSGAAVSLANVAATGALSATAVDALSATTISAGATSLSAGGGLIAAGLDTGPLTATASGDLAIDGAAVAGDASLTAGGDLTSSRMAVAGRLAAESGGALAGDELTFAGFDGRAGGAATLSNLAGGALGLEAGSVVLSASDLGDATIVSRAGIAADGVTVTALTAGAEDDIRLSDIMAAGDVTLDAGGGLDVADTSFAALTGAAAGAVGLTRLTGGDLDVAAQSVSLTDSALDAVAIVSRAGVIAQTLDLAALTVTAAGAVELGSVAASGAIAVETGGALSADGVSFASLSGAAGGQAALSALSGGDLEIEAQSVALTDSALIAGMLTAREGIAVARVGMTSLSADAGGAVSLADATASATVEAQAGGDLDAARVAFAKFSGTAAGDARLTALTGGDLAVTARGVSLSDASLGAATVAASEAVVARGLTLDSLAATAGAAADLEIIAATGAIDVTAGGDLDARALSFAGLTATTGGVATLTLLTGGDLDVAAQSVDLTASTLGAVSLFARDGIEAEGLELASLSLVATGAARLANIDSPGALHVETGGAFDAGTLAFASLVAQAGGAATITALSGGALDVTAERIALRASLLDDARLVTVPVDPEPPAVAALVVAPGAGDVTLEAVDAAGDIAVAAEGDVHADTVGFASFTATAGGDAAMTALSGRDLEVTAGEVSLTASTLGAVVATARGGFSGDGLQVARLRAAAGGDIDLADTAAAGAIGLDAGGALDGAALSFASLDAAASGDATLTGLSGGDLEATGRNLSLTASGFGAGVIGAVGSVVAEDLTFASLGIAAGGDAALARLAGGALDAAAGADLTAGASGFDGAAFAAGGAMGLSGIAVADDLSASAGGALTGADIDAGGDAAFAAGGALDAAGLTVAGALTTDAGGDLDLSDSGFGTASGAVGGDMRLARLSGGAVGLDGAGDLDGAELTLAGGELSAAGAITLASSALGDIALEAGGALDLSMLEIAEGTASVGGAARLSGVAVGDFALIAAGDVTAGDLSGGDLSLTSASGAVRATRAALPEGRLALNAALGVDLETAQVGAADVSAGGGARIVDVSGGGLTATAGGALTASDLTFDAAGLTAGESATLTRATFRTLTLAAGGDAATTDIRFDSATLDAGGRLTLDQLTGGALTATSNGALAAAGLALSSARLAAGTDATLNASGIGALTLTAGAAASVTRTGFDGASLVSGAGMTLADLDGDALAASAGGTLSAVDIATPEARFAAGDDATLTGIAAGSLALDAGGDAAVSEVSFETAALVAGGALAMTGLEGTGLDATAGQALRGADITAARAGFAAGTTADLTRIAAADLTLGAGGAASLRDSRFDDAALTSGAGLTLAGLAGDVLSAQAGGALSLTDAAIGGADARSVGPASLARVTAQELDLAAEGDAALSNARFDTARAAAGGGLALDAVSADLLVASAGRDAALAGVEAASAELSAGRDVTLAQGDYGRLTLNAGRNAAATGGRIDRADMRAGGGLALTGVVAGTLRAEAGTAALRDVEIADADLLARGDAQVSGSRFDTLTAETERGDAAIETSTFSTATLTAGGALSLAGLEGGLLSAGSVGGLDGTEIVVGEAALTAGADAALTRIMADSLAAAAGGDLAVADLDAGTVGLTSGGTARLDRVQAGTLSLTAGQGASGADLTVARATVVAGDGLAIERAALETAGLQAGGEIDVRDSAGAGWTVDAGGRALIAGLALDTLAAETGGALSLADARIGSATLTSAGDARLDRVETGRLDLAVAGAIAGADIGLGSGALAAGAGIELGRIAAEGALSLEGQRVTLTDLAAGRLDVTAAGALSLDRAAVAGDAAFASGAAATLARARIGGALDLAATGEATLSDVTAATISVDTLAALTLDQVGVTGDLTARARGGDMALGPLAVGGDLRARAGAGDILSRDGAAATEAFAVAAPTPATLPGDPAPGFVDQTQPPQVFAELIRVDGAAWFDASGAVLLPGGAGLGNDFLSGVSIFAGDVAAISDINDLLIGAGAATLPGRGEVTRSGILGVDKTAPGSVRIDAGGAVVEAAGARIVSTGDLLVTAGGDIDLGRSGNRIDGAAGLFGANVTLAETGNILLGPVSASGDLTVLAGAEGAPASVTQTRGVETVALRMQNGRAARGTASRSGVLDIRGDAAFATGAPIRRTVEDLGLGLDLGRPDNVFGGAVSAQRFFGDVLIAEEATRATLGRDAEDDGVLTIRGLEAAGDITIRTSDDLVLAGRMTALTDDMDGERVAAPGAATDADWRAQGAPDIADDDLRLFIADGRLLTLDTTAGGVDAAGGMIRVDRALDGANTLSTAREAEAVAARGDAGAILLDAGARGDIRVRDWLGAGGPLGEIRVAEAMDVSFGQTFAGFDADPGDDRNRFLMGGPGDERDVITASGLVIDAHGEVTVHAPAGIIAVWEGDDDYYGVNAAYVTYGETIEPDSLELYGFIGESGQKAAGLFPVGPEGSQFKTNGCVVGDVQDCTGITPPRVLTLVRLQRAQILNVEEDDLLELFVSYGNEELWGIPQTNFSDVDLERAREAANRQASGDAAPAVPGFVTSEPDR